MVTRCSECGKHFDILYPDLWAYKTGSKIFCSWHCLRADERKEEDEMARLKKDGTPAKKPGPRKTVKTVKVPAVPPVEIPEQSVSIAPTPLVLQGGVDYQMKVDEDRKPRKPFKVIGLETDFGRFTMGTVKGVLRFKAEGETEISMVTEDWLKMAETLPEILRELGVDA